MRLASSRSIRLFLQWIFMVNDTNGGLMGGTRRDFRFTACRATTIVSRDLYSYRSFLNETIFIRRIHIMAQLLRSAFESESP